jgi:peptide/nickel transport system ATP-binding protein
MKQAPYAVDVAGLRKQFQVRSQRLGAKPQVVHAVSDISFRLVRGHTLGIVGESGCGKSTLARLMMGLIDADDGDVVLAGQRLGSQPAQLAAVRRKVQMVFQDSFASLNPRLTVEASVMFGPAGAGCGAQTSTAHGARPAGTGRPSTRTFCRAISA